MHKIILFLIAFNAIFKTEAQLQVPADVQNVIGLTSNKVEFNKVIAYFNKPSDSLKLKAAFFLIANMDTYYSEDYYLADSNENKIILDESSYSNYIASQTSFSQVKKPTNINIHAVKYKYKDIDTITAQYLIENINTAVDSWNNSIYKAISFSDFCEYILPHRISVEPLQNWRDVYNKKFSWIRDSINAGSTTVQFVKYVAIDFSKWFTNTYKIETRIEPLPRLGALHLLQRKKGACEDIADLEVFTLRSQGIPATIDLIPYWATASGKHWVNVTFDTQMKPVSFDISTPTVTENKLAREPAKVIRLTYSKQPTALATTETLENIPIGFLRTTNYIDVTNEYWPTNDVICNLFPYPSSGTSTIEKDTIAFACVFNFLNWRAAWWGSKKHNTVLFKNMCKGAVFLPMYYVEGKLVPAGYPKVSGYNNELELVPDTINTHKIYLAEKEKYLSFQTGKKYKLYYWNNKWKLLGTKVANANTKELVFDNVPKNALLLLLPEYSQQKERPFIVLDDGQRLLW